jgi:Spx/MgsR family transcriptional regulator
MYTVYGIKNCNTVKKALDYLNGRKVPYIFHDYKKAGITKKKLTGWSGQIGWEPLINKKGTTWRALDEETKNSIANKTAAFDLAIAKTSVIKRPLIELDGKVIALGFDQETYDAIDWTV